MLTSRRFWLGAAITAGFLALLLAQVDYGELGDALASAQYAYVVPAVAIYFGSLYFRSVRWRYMLSPFAVTRVSRLYPVVVVGYTANNLLPMRLGELVRSYYVGEREGISKTSALVTIFIERLLDALTLLLFVVVIALFAPVTGLAQAFRESHGAAWLLAGAALAVIFVAAFGLLLLVAFAPTRASAIAKVLVNPLPERVGSRLRQLFDMFLDGVQTLSSPGSILVLFALSTPIWLFEAGLFFLIGYSFGLHEVYPSLGQMAVALVLVTAIANIGSSIPAAPGGIGLFELVARETLVLLPLAAVDGELAGAYVLVVHAALLLPMIVLGQIFLWTQHVSFLRLSRAGRSVAGGPD